MNVVPILALEAPGGAPFQFLVLFLAIVIGPRIIERAKVPGIIGLLLAGFAIGPNGFGWIGSTNHTVPEFGELGLLYLMFVAGLELDLDLLRRHLVACLGFGVLTFALPMSLGTGVGLALGWDVGAALLLGSLAASHTLITYPTVRDAGLAGRPAVAVAVGATVLTDTLALVVLALVAGTETGSGSTVTIAAEIVIGVVVLAVGSVFGLPVLARWCFRAFGSDSAVRYLVAISSFLLAATVAGIFGIEGIVGAFFAGLGLNRLVPNEGPSMERIEFFGSAVFIPIFLVSVGLILDPSVMGEGETLKTAACIIAACMGGKALATLLGRPLFGWSANDAGLVFSLTAPQAAATLAATLIGLQIGLFSTSVVNAVLVLIVVSLVLSSLLAERFAGRAERAPAPPGGLTSHILVVAGGGLPSSGLLALAQRLANQDAGVVHVVDIRTEGEAAGEESHHRALTRSVHAAGIDADVVRFVDESLAVGAVHAAAAVGATLVLADLGDDGRVETVHDFTAARRRCPSPPIVLVHADGPFRGVGLVVEDGSDGTTTVDRLADRLDHGHRSLEAGAWSATREVGELVVLDAPVWERTANGTDGSVAIVIDGLAAG